MSNASPATAIAGMGVYLPEQVRTNDWWSDEYIASHLRSLADDVRTTANFAAHAGVGGIDPAVARLGEDLLQDPFRGIRERRVLGEGISISEMEAKACERALENADVDKSKVDFLITYSLPNQYPIPGNELLIARRLGLNRTTQCLTIDAACASFAAHLQYARSLIATGEATCILVCQSYTGSHLADFEKPSSVIMGDGAVASVLVPSDSSGLEEIHVEILPECFEGLVLKPKTSDAPWYRGDLHQEHLHPESLDRNALIKIAGNPVSLCGQVCTKLLQKCGIDAEEIDYFLTSQPTLWFSDACCEELSIPINRTLTTFEAFGHLMAASLPLNLYTAFREGKLPPGSLLLMYVPGAGLRAMSVLYRVPEHTALRLG